MVPKFWQIWRGTLLLIPVLSCAREPTTCQSNIVSATVVATFCGHAEGYEQVLDALLLWRGSPGWFQRAQGGGGERIFGGWTSDNYVEAHQTYGETTIGYEGDFHARTLKIGETTVSLKNINTVRIDAVDRPGARHIVATSWTEPRLRLLGDVNVMLAQQSPEVLRDLQCELPMPAGPPGVPQIPVITVCEKIGTK